MRRFFNKVWGGIKDNIGAIAGGALGGPIGALIGMAVQELLRGADIPLSPEAEKIAAHWADNFFSPFFLNSVEWVGKDRIINNKEFVAKYNQILIQLRSWQAFYEAQANNPSTKPLDKEIATAKQLILLQSVDIFKKAYEEASVENPSDLFFENQEYDPTIITDVAGDKLDWNAIGVKTILANNMFLTDGSETPQSQLIKNTFQKLNKKLPKPVEDQKNPKKDLKPEKEKENKPPPQNKPKSPELPKSPINDTDIVEEEEAQTKGGLKKLLIGTAIGVITYKVIIN